MERSTATSSFVSLALRPGEVVMRLEKCFLCLCPASCLRSHLRLRLLRPLYSGFEYPINHSLA